MWLQVISFIFIEMRVVYVRVFAFFQIGIGIGKLLILLIN